MPRFKHVVEVDYSPTFRAQKVVGMFDVPASEKLRKEWEVDLPIEDKEWEIGLIVGPSGSGKTTLAKRIFGEEAYHTGFDWSSKPIVDDFPKGVSVDQITGALSHVGFSSPPDWIKPFSVLSNGQKFRAEMARLVLEDRPLVVVDEFTSVVDRQVARYGSSAIQKFIRSSGKRFVAVSCHYDIVDWLQPDWIYHVDTGKFEYTRGCLRRPEIRLHIRRVHHSAWRIFRGHHYLSAELNHSAHCYVGTIEDKPVGFVAALKFPHPHVKNMWKAHRTVILPDYQGLGVGHRMSVAIAEHYLAQGCRYTSVTSHPAFIASRMRDPRWRLTRSPGQVPAAGKNSKVTGQSVGRMTAAFEYIGAQAD